MRIVAITTSYPRHEADHAGRFVHDLNAGLRELDCDVTTICPASPDAPRRERTDGGEVIRVAYGADELFYGDGLEANWRRARRPFAALRRWIASAERALLEIDADLVVPHWLWPSGAAALRGARRAPVVGVGHGGDLHLLDRPIVGRWLARSIRGMRGALVTSRFGADVVRRRTGVDRIAIAPMGVDPRRFAAADLERPNWPEGYVFGVGRLLPIKGFDVAIRACARLALPLVIAGEGPEREALTTLADEVGCRLHLTGPLGPAQVAAGMRHARCVVVTSREMPGGRTEGCPVVAVEALVAGATVIATATGGLPDLLSPNALVPPDDLEALIDRLRQPPASAALAGVPVTRRDTARTLLSLAAD